VYIIGASPTGAWTGKAQQIAYFDQVWRYIVPQSGSALWVEDSGVLQVFNGVSWRISTARMGTAAVQRMEINASSMSSALISGCAPLSSIALGTNQPDIVTLNFDAAVLEYALFTVTPPSAWNGQPFTVDYMWSHATASGSFGVVWSLQALARADDDTLAASYGTAVSVSDTGGSANRLYVSPRSSVITPAGTLGAGGALYFRIAREATVGGDTLAVDARLHAVRLYFDV
jgi:hypothetical protein